MHYVNTLYHSITSNMSHPIFPILFKTLRLHLYLCVMSALELSWMLGFTWLQSCPEEATLATSLAHNGYPSYPRPQQIAFPREEPRPAKVTHAYKLPTPKTNLFYPRPNLTPSTHTQDPLKKPTPKPNIFYSLPQAAHARTSFSFKHIKKN